MRERFRIVAQYYKRIKPYLKRARFLQYAAMVCAIVNISCVIAYNWIYKIIIDDALLPKKYEVLFYVSVIYIILVLFAAVSNILKIYLFTKINQTIIVNLQGDLYQHIMDLPFPFFVNTKHGDIIYRLINDVNNTQKLIFEVIVELVTNFLTVLLVFTWLFIINWKFTIIFVLLLPLYVVLSNKLGNRIYQTNKEINEYSSEAMSIIQETLLGIELIKQNMLQNIFSHKFVAKLSLLAKRTIRLSFLSHLSYSLLGMALQPLMAVYYMIFGYFYITTGSPSIGSLLAYTNYFWVLFPAALGLNELYYRIMQTFSSVERLLEYLNMPKEKGGREHLTGKEDIVFDHVSFSYNEQEKYVLKDVNLVFKAGENNVIMGKTGAGKTTILKLLLGFYQCQSGAIRFGDHNINDCDLSSLRGMIGIVSQDIFLFNTTIKENLLLANPQSSPAEIANAVKIAQIHEFIQGLPDGYDTLVGQHGMRLSGGEKQRLAIARIILRKPKIIIFDEPTSALDEATEQAFWERYLEEFKTQTKIIITHRPFIMKYAGNVFVIGDGRMERIRDGDHQGRQREQENVN